MGAMNSFIALRESDYWHSVTHFTSKFPQHMKMTVLLCALVLATAGSAGQGHLGLIKLLFPLDCRFLGSRYLSCLITAGHSTATATANSQGTSARALLQSQAQAPSPFAGLSLQSGSGDVQVVACPVTTLYALSWQ